MIRRFIGLVLSLLAVVVVLLGLWVPVYFYAVSPDVLAEAATPEDSLLARAEQTMRRGETGPAAWLLNAMWVLEMENPRVVALDAELAERLAQQPEYRVSGGEEPYFAAFFAELRPDYLPGKGAVPLAELLALSRNRALLHEFLSGSSDAIVLEMLKTREAVGWGTLMPLNTAGGAALDAAVLTSALLVQAGFVEGSLLRELDVLAMRVNRVELDAVAELEVFYLAMLSAAQRFNYMSLGEWVKQAPTALAFEKATHELRGLDEQRMALFYSAALLSGEPLAVADYISAFPESAWGDLEKVLPMGGGALDIVINEQRPVYVAPAWLAWLAIAPSGSLCEFILVAPELALGVKLLVLAIGSFLLAFGLRCLFQSQRSFHGSIGLQFSQNLILAICMVIALISATEPSIFAQDVNEPGKLYLEFQFNASVANLGTDTMNIGAIDQITVIILLIFFVMQLIIYAGCLVKISQLKRAPMPADTKLELLENEDYLFDLGLYVGLAGTVVSLLMLAMGVVQASLVAAYASTLFGIIFVALLKILNVRPFRRRLILECSHR